MPNVNMCSDGAEFRCAPLHLPWRFTPLRELCSELKTLYSLCRCLVHYVRAATESC